MSGNLKYIQYTLILKSGIKGSMYVFLSTDMDMCVCDFCSGKKLQESKCR